VRGQVKVKSFTDDPEELTRLTPLTDEAGEHEFELTFVGRSKDLWLARIEGVNDRDAALALKGQRLYAAREALPAPEEDEFYYADLIGLRVELEDGTEIGTVRALHDFGAGDVVEITPKERGGPWATAMLPFTAEAVPVVDVKAGRLVIVPPPGLFGDEDEGGEETGGHEPR
jgi:16S rRNA processing protein RimM